MIPVMQTIFGKGGNCHAACMASILELPLDALPNPPSADDRDMDAWQRAWEAELSHYNLGMVIAQPRPGWAPPGYSILCGTSPRGEWNHAIVCYDGQLVHDPHPDGMGVEAYLDWTILTALDPAALFRIEAAARELSTTALHTPLAAPGVDPRQQALYRTNLDALLLALKLYDLALNPQPHHRIRPTAPVLPRSQREWLAFDLQYAATLLTEVQLGRGRLLLGLKELHTHALEAGDTGLAAMAERWRTLVLAGAEMYLQELARDLEEAQQAYGVDHAR